jgi:uncharacterized glyoxalase superfamily protein PhnB
MSETSAKFVWPTVRCKDARASIEFLTEAFGFEETLVVPADDDPKIVVHAEMRWPEGGGIMLGSLGAGEVLSDLGWAPHAVYVVTDRPDELFERAEGADAEVVRGLVDEDYGSRGFTVLDPEGNYWSFGTYRGA